MSATDQRIKVLGVYLRISPKPEENREVLAIDRQRTECLRACKRHQLDKEHGWETRFYIDQSVSATSKRERRDYQRMIADMRAGILQAVAVLDQDRLVRKPRELEEFIDIADSFQPQIKLITAGGELDLNDPNDRMFARMKGAVSKHEMEQKTRRQKLMHAQRREHGRPWAPNRPFGFLSGGMAHHPVEAPVVRDMFNDFLAGVPQIGIAAGLNQAGHPTTFGKKWGQSAVRQLLLNPRYAGLCGYMDADTRLWSVVGPGSWQPIVPEETWRAASATITSNLKGRGSKSRQHLLSSLIFCGLCGARLTINYAARSQNPHHRYYKCRSCGRIARSADDVELLVEGAVTRRLSAPDAHDLLVDDSRPQAGELRVEANVLRKRLDQFAAERARGELSDAEWNVMRNTVKARLNEVEDAMSHLVRSPLLGQLVNGETEKIWANMTIDRKRVVIQDLLKVTVLVVTRPGQRAFDPDQVRLEWLL